MIPAPFEYERATSVDEAVGLLQKYGSEAKVLAGGHSLIPTLKLRFAQPGYLIDIGRISDLDFIRVDGDDLLIGAGTTHDAIASSELVQQRAPALAAAAAQIGDVQVRNKGTLGGSLAHADPAADYPAAILAHETVITAVGPEGDRAIEAGEFFTEIFTTAIEENEIITQVRVPKALPGTTAAYLKFPNPASGYAVVGCAVVLTVADGKCSDVRVAFTGVANTAFREPTVEAALKGKAVTAENIAAAAASAAAGQDALSDTFASAEYRLHLAKVYAKRALLAAAGLG